MLAGAGMLDRFLGGQQAQATKAPMGKAAEVAVDLLERRGPPYEADGAVVGEVCGQVGPPVRCGWNLAVTAKIDAAEDHMATARVAEPRPVDFNLRQRHNHRHPPTRCPA
jgi:hypothetical protein